VLAGVTRAFGALRAVDDVSFSVAAGEKAAILGSNGAGKTTLFNAITGDFPAHRRADPFLRRRHHRAAAARAHPQGPPAHLPVFAAVSRPHGARQPLPRGPRRRQRPLQLLARRPQPSSTLATHDLLERTRLTHIAETRVADLAHGQQRQLEIGMALAGAPRLILFDEPAAGLSPAERRELVALLASLPPHMSYL
jgi:branched-chain amino acid transport system ATP-binding protein